VCAPKLSLVKDDLLEKNESAILRLNTANLLARDVVFAKCEELCKRAEIDAKDFEVRGSALGRRFTLAFGGTDDATAARRAKKTHGMLRCPDTGAWEELKVTRPDKSEEVLYISPDRSGPQFARETGGKALQRMLKARYSGKPFTFLKRDAAIILDWQIVAQVSFDHEILMVRIEWKEEFKAEIDRGVVEAEFAILQNSKGQRG
jgi:hypothetical protein